MTVKTELSILTTSKLNILSSCPRSPKINKYSRLRGINQKIFWTRNDFVTPVVTLVSGQQVPQCDLRMIYQM